MMALTAMSERAGHTLTSAELPLAAARIVSELTGAKSLAARLIHHGVMTFKCEVETETAGAFMVRFYPAGRESVVRCEPDLLARCRDAGMGVPTVIGDSRTGPTAPLSYMAYHRIDGDMLSRRLCSLDASRQIALARELADDLQCLQHIEFRGYGELQSASGARAASWPEFVAASCRAGVGALDENEALDKTTRDAIRQVVDRAAALPHATRPLLVWGDINFDNIIVNDDGRIAGLIDFESCLSGDPLATLGYGFAVHGHLPFFAELLKACCPGGLSQEESDRVMLYALLRGLRLARYAHLPLPTGHSRDPLVEVFPGVLPALAHLSERI
jgi:aminoglycoside phosphotransferase (APT) family kinase protein